MENNEKKEDRSSLAIGGGVLMGVGVGFFFLHTNKLAFVGSILVGLGFGLLMSSFISEVKNR